MKFKLILITAAIMFSVALSAAPAAHSTHVQYGTVAAFDHPASVNSETPNCFMYLTYLTHSSSEVCTAHTCDIQEFAYLNCNIIELHTLITHTNYIHSKYTVKPPVSIKSIDRHRLYCFSLNFSCIQTYS